MPFGILSSGTYNGVDLSNPVNRVAVASVADNLAHVPALQRPEQHPDVYDFNGVSNYDSLQVTLSRQTGRRLQYFVAYTLGKTRGHARRRVLATSTRTIRAAPTACSTRTARTS